MLTYTQLDFEFVLSGVLVCLIWVRFQCARLAQFG
jgi:hypothetical protein